MQYCVYAHALSWAHVTETHLELEVANKDKEKKLATYRAWPWISNCWEWDSNSGLSGIESSALTTRPSRLGANLRRDATSRLLFLDQSVLADFDPRKRKKESRILRLVAFQARVISANGDTVKYPLVFSQAYVHISANKNKSCRLWSSMSNGVGKNMRNH